LLLSRASLVLDFLAIPGIFDHAAAARFKLHDLNRHVNFPPVAQAGIPKNTLAVPPDTPAQYAASFIRSCDLQNFCA
jgi:hypothetical protein